MVPQVWGLPQTDGTAYEQQVLGEAGRDLREWWLRYMDMEYGVCMVHDLVLGCALGGVRTAACAIWRHAPNGGVGIGRASSSAVSEVPTRRKPPPPPKEGDTPLKGETPPKSDARPSRPTRESTPSSTLSTPVCRNCGPCETFRFGASAVLAALVYLLTYLLTSY